MKQTQGLARISAQMCGTGVLNAQMRLKQNTCASTVKSTWTPLPYRTGVFRLRHFEREVQRYAISCDVERSFVCNALLAG